MQVADRMAFIERHFGVEFIRYDRAEDGGILVASGCGIGMGLMDCIPALTWFVDVDAYRQKTIDWECISVIASLSGPAFFLLAGWFSLDKPQIFRTFERGICGGVPFHTYIGGEEKLTEVIDFARRYSRTTGSAR